MKYHLWMDIETDGPTSRESGELLEVGGFITDIDTHEFVAAFNYVITPRYSLESLTTRMSDKTIAKHEASGLIDHLKHQSFDVADAQEDMIEFMDRYGDKGDFILSGRDIPEIVYWLPKLGLWIADERLDLGGFSAVLKAAGFTDQLEPIFDDPMPNRAGKDAQRYFHEFLFYKELLETIPFEID